MHRPHILCLCVWKGDHLSANLWQLEDAMTPFLIVLLFFGLSLNLCNPASAGTLSKPTLRAVPGNVVATGNQVTFFCEGPSETKEYRLYKVGSQDYLIPTGLLEIENKAKFSISSVEWYNAGQYWCYYKSTNGKSGKSDILELVVTGAFPSRVTLSATPSPVVNAGERVTLQCVSQEPYNMSILMKDGENFSSPMPLQKIHSDLFGALFSVGSLTPNQRWRFTCYGYFLSSPQLWSVPSNQLELLVSGVPETTSQPQNMSEATIVSQPQDHTVENIIRMGISGLILIVLGTLLFEACHSQGRP